MSGSRGIAGQAWPGMHPGLDGTRTQGGPEAQAASTARTARAGQRLPAFTTVPRLATLQRRPPPRRSRQLNQVQDEWDDDSELDQEESGLSRPSSGRPGSLGSGSPDDEEVPGRRTPAEHGDAPRQTDGQHRQPQGRAGTPNPRPALTRASTPTGTGNLNDAACSLPGRLGPPRLAGFDGLFETAPGGRGPQGLQALAHYLVAVVRNPGAVRDAGWRTTALLAVAARRSVDMAASQQVPAASFQEIRAALVAACAALEPQAAPAARLPAGAQDLLVLLPLFLLNSQRRRTASQRCEAAARLEVLAAATAQPRR